MTSSTSIISLANRALLAVGGRSQISSLDEGSPAANAVNLLFNPCYEALARSAWWNTLRAQATLSLLKAAQGTPENPNGTLFPIPPSPWLYSYLLPPNCLHARFVLPSINSGTSGTTPLTTVNNAAPTILSQDGSTPFEIGYDTDALGNPLTVVLTDQTQAQLMYTVNQPNPAIWDSQFQAAFVASLAALLTPALTLNTQLMTVAIAQADRIIAEARAADANEGSSTQNRMADWMRARQSGRSADGYSGMWTGGRASGGI